MGICLGTRCCVRQRLSTKSVRKSDIVARIGGDEFLIFVEYNGDISTVADVSSNPLAGCIRISISASMGVALSPIHATEYELLFHYADQALYAAKHRGRNCYCIYEDSIDSFYLYYLKKHLIRQG